MTEDDAIAFIRTIGDELIMAGMPAGDRSVILANIRRLCAVAKREKKDTDEKKGKEA